MALSSMAVTICHRIISVFWFCWLFLFEVYCLTKRYLSQNSYMKIKDLLKSFKPIYHINSILKARRVERKIAKELTYYRRLVKEKGIVYSEEDARQRLQQRLKDRGLRQKRKGDFHIVYASRPSNWEPHNIPPELSNLGKVTLFYWSERGFDDYASDWMNRRSELDTDFLKFMWELHAEDPIDVLVSYFTGARINPKTIGQITDLGIFTCNFSWDDKLSFRGQWLSGRWSGPAAIASAVDLNLTNAESSCIKYMAEGGIALFWPEGANPDFYRPYDLPFEYDVSFIGGRYGFRPILIEYLRKNGVDVATFGPGWDSREIPAEEMPKIYSKSRINLGFGGIGYSMKAQCLKGRDFEVPMSGGLYLTSYNPELSSCYEVGKEILCYNDKKDCLEKIRDLLSHPEKAEAIRQAGRVRATNEHTWEKRFEKIFTMAGLLID